MLRRRRVPAELEPALSGFDEALRLVEGAKEAIVDAVPRARAPGRPLAEALIEFEELLREAAQSMDAWRHPAVASEWDACLAGIEEALHRAERLRLEAPELSFDQLAFTVQDLIAPMEPFEAAALAFRRLEA